MSTSKIRGLLRSDSNHGGVAMISSSESVADGGSGGSGGSGSDLGRGGGHRKGSSRRGSGSSGESWGGVAISNGSLREVMQNRTHFDDDDDEAEDGSQDSGSRKPAATKGAPPPPAAAPEGKVAPRATAPTRGLAAGLAAGTPGTRRRHRRHRSPGSNSSLMSVESLGIVAAAAPVGPPTALAAAGTGVVAMAVARVEDGPADDTVKAILAKAKAKQIAEEVIASSRRQKRIVVPKVNWWRGKLELCTLGLLVGG